MVVRVFVTGGTGLVGSRVVVDQLRRGNDVIVVSRNEARAVRILPAHDSLQIIQDDVNFEGKWQEAAGDCDAVVHLAGSGIFDHRWSSAYKKTMRDSRIGSTKHVATVANGTFVCASATGIYGDRGDTPLDEQSDPGSGFLSRLCQEWEKEACNSSGRVVMLRFGIVLDKLGGALGRMLPIFRLGLGGPIGNGRQYWPWIAWQDVVEIIAQSVDGNWQGPINVVAPEPVDAKTFAKTLGGVLHRPAFLPVPKCVISLAVGQAGSVLTSSQNVVPAFLQRQQFGFKHPSLHSALTSMN